MSDVPMASRVTTVKTWCDQLVGPEAIEAVVRDGWPRAMVEAGFERHAETWNPELIESTYAEEVEALGDEEFASRLPGSLHHIWPALPGAGVTPVLYATVGGIEDQRIRASSRATHFARYFSDLTGVRLDDAWENADAVIVSGSDETVAEVKRRARGNVVAYGHRVSYGVVEEGAGDPVIDGFAQDAVLWHQRGCFSLRGIVFVGSPERARTFREELAGAIAKYEHLWGEADGLSEAELAAIHQGRGVAEFRGRTSFARIGWVEEIDAPMPRSHPAPHAVYLGRVDSFDAVYEALENLNGSLQGVAHSVRDADRLETLLEPLGPTRFCEPGTLQVPPASWPHDGLPNFTSLLLPAR